MVTPRQLHVRPAIPGAVIRDPRTRRPLPDDGGRVPDSTFWNRRLLAGEVVEVTAEPTPAAPPRRTRTIPTEE
jgi:hypothetical protein